MSRLESNGDGGMKMNRIEQIKKNLADGKYYGNEFVNMAKDIEYMLSVLNHPQEFWQLYDRFETKIQEKLLLKDKLEIAEKALESIAVPMPGSRDNQLVIYYERKAAEALKSIRE